MRQVVLKIVIKQKDPVGTDTKSEPFSLCAVFRPNWTAHRESFECQFARIYLPSTSELEDRIFSQIGLACPEHQKRFFGKTTPMMKYPKQQN